ncbi:maleylpyruvate isomerase family mycothiol-dependent enzyme [Geothrix sp. 21YS21S-2]|uniref:maleylpyruvate isomerase family mycothiol-dependent enzyme n=1 Tax=Geothrix sp. 21YS21S-2 TaxID=3068893 RepID=UPI0027B96A0A|nr:maleylpyruvate isomerase family mycothiol-dependent enzyme [Geothrix sp. 21YS21S-2]
MTASPIFDPRPIIARVHASLLDLLATLTPEDWRRPTVARRWCVKDVAAHLLDGQLRRLAVQRDGWFSGRPEPGEPLVAFLNRLNATWVEASARLSPEVLRGLLAWTGGELAAAMSGLDLAAPATFPVAWAGETASTTRFDLARDLTEHWIHQQQIRLAVGAPPLVEADLLHPVMDTLLRALPHAYRGVACEPGATLRVELTGDAPRVWCLRRDVDLWTLHLGEGPARSTVALDPETAWLLLSKALGREEALGRVRLTGDQALAMPLLETVAVMA